MARDNPVTSGSQLSLDLVGNPHIRLCGEINDDSLRTLLDGISRLNGEERVVAVEISTLGGDPEIARRMLLEMDLLRARRPGCRFVLIGKTAVYSAGVSFMAAFPVRDRFLTSDTVLLIHCRQLEKTVELQGPLRASLPHLEALCHELRTGIALETKNFERLIANSDVKMDELREKALYNWYLPACEAQRRGLVAEVIGNEEPHVL